MLSCHCFHEFVLYHRLEVVFLSNYFLLVFIVEGVVLM